MSKQNTFPRVVGKLATQTAPEVEAIEPPFPPMPPRNGPSLPADLFDYPVNHDLKAPRHFAPDDIVVGMNFKTQNGVIVVTSVTDTHVTYRYQS